MVQQINDADIQRFADAYNKLGSLRAASREVGVSHGKASHKRYKRALERGLIERPGAAGGRTRDDVKEATAPQGRVRALAYEAMATPAPGRVNTYLLTCAQNDTELHGALVENLQVLADYYSARIMVARFTYDKRAQAADLDKKVATGRSKVTAQDMSWDPRIPEGWFSDDPIELAPGLLWCGEMNIIPTAVRPLSGLEAYTGRRSGIFPHVKLAMESVATHKGEGTKFNYTTGTVTQRNYIQRKAGLKAEFHHCYGALLVEVDSDGIWFCRQINASSLGTIFDLDIQVENGRLTTGHAVEGINWGDIHKDLISSVVEHLGWGEGGMFKVLRPRFQIFHDLLNFGRRNHHDLLNPHKMFELHVKGMEDVAAEIGLTAEWLVDKAALSSECQTLVVHSNHDAALELWLRNTNFKTDPLNAEFYLEAQLAKYCAIRAGDDNFDMLEWACHRAITKKLSELSGDNISLWPSPLPGVKFLRKDESFIICPDAGGGIECGMHGHLGPHGSRGSAGAFARMGRKSNVGHTHRAGIVDGVYVAGTSSELDLGYNVGPGAWSWTHIVTYANGKRALYTMYGDKWRAVR